MKGDSELDSYRETVIFYITRALYIYAVGAIIFLVIGDPKLFWGWTWGTFGAIIIFRLHSLTIARVPDVKAPALYMRFHYIIRLLLFAIFVIIAAKKKQVNVFTTIGGLFIVKVAIYLFRPKRSR